MLVVVVVVVVARRRKRHRWIRAAYAARRGSGRIQRLIEASGATSITSMHGVGMMMVMVMVMVTVMVVVPVRRRRQRRSFTSKSAEDGGKMQARAMSSRDHHTRHHPRRAHHQAVMVSCGIRRPQAANRADGALPRGTMCGWGTRSHSFVRVVSRWLHLGMSCLMTHGALPQSETALLWHSVRMRTWRGVCDRPGEMGRAERMCGGIAAARAVFECIPPHVPRTRTGAATVLTCASQPWLLCRARGRLHEGTHEGTSNCSARKVELWGRPSGVWLDVPTTRMVRIRLDASQLVGRGKRYYFVPYLSTDKSAFRFDDSS